MNLVLNIRSLLPSHFSALDLQGVAEDETLEGQRSTEIFATSLQHFPNGRFITDGEYIIYTTICWRNKVLGSGSSFAKTTNSN